MKFFSFCNRYVIFRWHNMVKDIEEKITYYFTRR